MQSEHPVKVIEERFLEGDEMMRTDMIRRTEGLHMAMTLATERQLFPRDRLPGVKASNIHADILAGKDTSIDFSDFLSG